MNRRSLISTHHVTLRIMGIARNAKVLAQQVDEDHGNALKAYVAVGSPRYPTRAQAQQMNAASALPAPEHLALRDGALNLDLKPNELLLLRRSRCQCTTQQTEFHPSPGVTLMRTARALTAILATMLTLGPIAIAQSVSSVPVSLTIDAADQRLRFRTSGRRRSGSGRAILSLRESYRTDLNTVKDATDFESVRFHAIFQDEVGLYDPDRKSIEFAQTAGKTGTTTQDTSAYNFSYIDQIYDGLLARHLRPYVELSFMPKKMAADPNKLHPFWYHPNVSPPKSYDDWDAMIRAFTQHLVNRYGLDAVATWKFEVWNEPNLDFWGGEPKQATYFELYDHTARAIKSVSPRLQVGGPSTAQAAWVTPFLQHVKDANVPIDFVSTHVYANDTAHDVFRTDEKIPRDEMVYRSVKKVHDQIASSPFPNLPLIFSEYNASYANEPNVTDTDYMGPWLANTIRQCDGLVSNMAYWSFLRRV